MTLAEALKANKGIGPGFHFLRHALSATILLIHCRMAIYGLRQVTAAMPNVTTHPAAVATQHYDSGLLSELLRPGIYSLVAAFFALSGFLVTGSAIRTGKVGVFLTNRALRIFPALSVEVTLSALILGALVTTLSLSDYYTDPQFFRYFGNIVGHVTFYLPGVFASLPYPDVVNGNLWTLQPEFWCYAVMAIIIVVGLLTHLRLLSLVAVAMIIGATIADLALPGWKLVIPHGGMFPGYYITIMFFIGVMFFVYADKIPLHWWLFVLCALGFHLSVFFAFLPALSGVFLTYCVVYVGTMKFEWFDRAMKSDYSYGIYLYGFPIMQTVVFFMMPFVLHWTKLEQLLLLIPVVFVLTLAFAAMSWRIIEKPALSLRRYISPKQKIVPPAAA